MISLERRLHVGLTLGLTLLMGIFWLVGNHVIRGLGEDAVAQRLRLDAWTLEGALVFGDEPPPPRRHRLAAAYDHPLSGHYYLVRNDDGRELKSPSLEDRVLEIPQLGSGVTRRMLVEGPAGEELLMLLLGFHREGQGFTIAVSEDLAPLRAEQAVLLRNFALIAGGGLLVLLLLQRLLVRRALGVLERVREDVHRLERGGSPQLSEEVPPELLPLVRDVNHMLSLVGQRLERSRNALGNLAQALKRPLALLIRYLDEEEEEQGDERWQRVHPDQQVASIRRLTSRGIRRVGLSEQGVPRQPFDPRADLAELATARQREHLEFDLSVQEGMPPFGDREEIVELLGNLLDRACGRAVSRVSCRFSGTGEGADEVEIQVADDGPGLAAPNGLQPDDWVEEHGLAVARDIVRLYGGTLNLSDSSELGGLQVRVLLPGDTIENEE